MTQLEAIADKYGYDRSFLRAVKFCKKLKYIELEQWVKEDNGKHKDCTRYENECDEPKRTPKRASVDHAEVSRISKELNVPYRRVYNFALRHREMTYDKIYDMYKLFPDGIPTNTKLRDMDGKGAKVAWSIKDMCRHYDVDEVFVKRIAYTEGCSLEEAIKKEKEIDAGLMELCRKHKVPYSYARRYKEDHRTVSNKEIIEFCKKNIEPLKELPND